MYLLDTNVVSELRKTRPHGGVLAWLKEVPEDSVLISVVTLGELQAGVERTRRQDPAKAAEIDAKVSSPADSGSVWLTKPPALRRQGRSGGAGSGAA
jgi:predicted nucleic acid-binding protein